MDKQIAIRRNSQSCGLAKAGAERVERGGKEGEEEREREREGESCRKKLPSPMKFEVEGSVMRETAAS